MRPPGEVLAQRPRAPGAYPVAVDLMPLVFSTGWASGVNAYLVVLVLGIAERVGGFGQIPDELGRWDGRPAGYDYPATRWPVGAAQFGTVRDDLEALIDHASSGSRLRPVPAKPAELALRALGAPDVEREGTPSAGVIASLTPTEDVPRRSHRSQIEQQSQELWRRQAMFEQTERVAQIGGSVPSAVRALATVTFSIIALEMPMALIG